MEKEKSTEMKIKRLALLSLALIIINSFFVVAEIKAPEISSKTHENNVLSNKTSAIMELEKIEGIEYYLYQITSRDIPADSKWLRTDKNMVLLANLVDGKKNFFAKACSKDSCSEYSTFTLQIDSKGPATPNNIKTFSTKDGILITWDKAQDESGISTYVVYRNSTRNYYDREFKHNDPGVMKFETNENFFLDTEGLQKGRPYYYRLTTIDRLGNKGLISGIFIGRNDWSECEKKPIIITPGIIGYKNKEIVVQSEEEISNVKVFLQYDKEEEVFSEQSAGKKFVFTIEPKKDYFGKLIIKVSYADSKNRVCTQEKQAKVDTIAPKIEITNKKIQGDKIIVSVMVSEEDEVASVKATKQGVAIAEGFKVKNNIYEFALEKNLFENELYLVANDLAGNITEKALTLEKAEKVPETSSNEQQQIIVKGLNEQNSQEYAKQQIQETLIIALIVLIFLIAVGLIVFHYNEKKEKKQSKTFDQQNKKPKWKITTKKE